MISTVIPVFDQAARAAPHEQQHPIQAGPGEVVIHLPDFFQGFLQQKPLLNPHYESVRAESEQWLSSKCELPMAMQKKVHKCDFSYFCAITAPHAGREEFRVLCDWGNWVFPYDDMFDVGKLRDRPAEARRVMESLLEPFISTSRVSKENRLPVIQAHDDIASRLFSGCSTEIKLRYLLTMQDYSYGVLAHVENQQATHNISIEDKIATRRESAGVSPLYHLGAFAHGLAIPNKVLCDPVVQEIETLGKDMVHITNDIISYRKEQRDGIPDNIVATYRRHGLSAQQAFDAAWALLELRYHSWQTAEAMLPSWGGEIDAQVREYIEIVKDVIRANLYWSFKSDRYLGADPDLVRQTRKIRVLENPPYLRR